MEGIKTKYKNPDNQCIANWKTLHERGYFKNHPHYTDWKLDAGYVDGGYVNIEFGRYVGLFKADDVLDIGCGYGRLMYTVADRVNTITGIDLHEAPLIKAREILKHKSNTDVILCDGQSIPLDNNSITLAYSFSTMQHISRSIVKKYIMETLRILKPGGRFCFQFLLAPKGLQDINHKEICEQSVGWIPEELSNITNDLEGNFIINECPLVLIGKV